jgi:hypothetical protein
MQPRNVFIAVAGLVAIAAPAAAQNTTTQPPVVAPASPTKTETPPATGTTPPATTTPEPAEPAAPPAVIVVPETRPAPPEPITIDPDVAYPNGFGDPVDPFANDMSLAYRESSGFDWGLLGLLGLFGLIPLFRRDRYARTVYVERDDEPRPVVRRERIE